jgi:hypothetical protein
MQIIEHQKYIVKGKKRVKYFSDCKSRTCGKGCVELKAVARHAGTSIFAVRVVNHITLLSRSPFSLGLETTLEKDRSSQNKSIIWKLELVAVEYVSGERTP